MFRDKLKIFGTNFVLDASSALRYHDGRATKNASHYGSVSSDHSARIITSIVA